MSTRIRKTITDDPDVGNVRRDIYSAAIDRYNQAFENQYYIECVSLMESLIADRLESLANEISSSRKYSYKTLEYLLRYLNDDGKKELLSDELLQCFKKVNSWKDGRNLAIHEMAKLSDDSGESFQTRYNRLSSIAKEGIVLFRELDSSIRRFRNNRDDNCV